MSLLFQLDCKQQPISKNRFRKIKKKQKSKMAGNLKNELSIHHE